METQKEFSDLVREDLLVWFCRHYGYSTDGFSSDTLQRVSKHDAKWFLDALSTETVARDGASFGADLGAAKEQTFWQGRTTISPRPLTIWVEPVITIGAACRLHTEFEWPKQLIGLQSHEGWAFDIIAHDALGQPRVAAVVKKTDLEIDHLIEAMTGYLSQPPLDEEPTDAKKRNAYRKVVALRRMRARLFWALGANGSGKVFRYRPDGEPGTSGLEEVGIEALRYE